MKTLNYSNEKRTTKLVNEYSFEILDNAELIKVRGGIMDPPIV